MWRGGSTSLLILVFQPGGSGPCSSLVSPRGALPDDMSPAPPSQPSPHTPAGCARGRLPSAVARRRGRRHLAPGAAYVAEQPYTQQQA
eukprot:COSAG01_NODE_190_length_22595_cov_16.442301_20_plen_88_part_00